MHPIRKSGRVWKEVLVVVLTSFVGFISTQEFDSKSEWVTQYSDRESDVSTSTTSTPFLPNRTLISMALSAELRPQYIFTFHGNDTEFVFDLAPMRHNNFDFKINIVVEKMKCHQLDGRYPPPFLVIQGVHENKTVKLCTEVDNTRNNFQTVQDVMDDVRQLIVRTEGDWTNLSAMLVASIYYEVGESCDNCAEGYFCCGDSSCYAGRVRTNWPDDFLFRCIPKYALSNSNDRSHDIVCNRHPNCGFYCNLDESRASCSDHFGDGCVGSDCRLADVALKIALLIVFCFLAPPVLVLIICRIQAVRKFCDRVNYQISTRTRHRSRNGSDSTIDSASEAQQTITTVCRQGRRGSNWSYNPADDPPPSYDDYLQSYKDPIEEMPECECPDPPPPSFEQALEVHLRRMLESDRQTINNLVSETQPVPRTFTVVTCEAVNNSIVKHANETGISNPAFVSDELTQS